MVCTPVASKLQACVILVLALVLTSCNHALASRGTIGVDYGLNGDNLLTPKQTVKLLCSRGIKRVRIYAARVDVIEAFADSGIDLTIQVPNEDVPKVAANLGEAFNWVSKYVLPFPTSGISAILVGNEWLLNPLNYDPCLLVPAMQNIYTALSKLKFRSGIKVSTPHSFDVLNNTFPPSAATFKEGVVPVMRPLLDFLEKSGSFFVVSIFPYFTYLRDEEVSLEFALFKPTQTVTDPNTGLSYTNLFDLQLDAAYAAITSLLSVSPTLLPSPCACNSSGIQKSSNEHVHWEATNLPTNTPKFHAVAGESGWPSGSGGSGTPPHTTLTSSSSAHVEESSFSRRAQYAATVENARTFNQNLIRHVLQAKGTPANPTTPIQAYIFALFNEDLKPPGDERHFGLFYPNGTAVYPINFHDRGK